MKLSNKAKMGVNSKPYFAVKTSIAIQEVIRKAVVRNPPETILIIDINTI